MGSKFTKLSPVGIYPKYPAETMRQSESLWSGEVSNELIRVKLPPSFEAVVSHASPSSERRANAGNVSFGDGTARSFGVNLTNSNC